MMAAVRGKDTKAEVALRRALHRRGVRFRLHAPDVLGRPDIVIRSKRLAVFADGDMWHGNAWRLRGLDRLEEMFPNNTEFWTKKIRRNIERDREVTSRLTKDGWTVVRLWESDILADPDAAASKVLEALRRSEHGG
jgi:DNA mismatch endonuclease, patch repair protein